MKLTLRGWNQPYQELQSIDDSLAYLDTHNKTRYRRRKNKEGLLEIASREAYENRKTHYATILLDDDTPYCAIASNTGYFGVDFLHESFDNYLSYGYRDNYSTDGSLFLEVIILCEYDTNTGEQIRSMNWGFTPEGRCSRIIFQGDWIEGTYQEIIDELPSLSEEELSKLWVPYPPFKEYEELMRLDRIPLIVRERILEYTDREFPAFREHLQRDIEKYQKCK